jgi:hypothetical protein
MSRLADGTVVPHFMGVKNTDRPQGVPSFFGEVAIMVGEVTKILYPDDPDNTSGQFVEYVVNVWRRKANGPLERLTFRCFQSDTFGSVADWFRFSFRAATSSPDKQPLSNGATVFVACVNGDRSNAFIIGAMPQPNRDELDPRRADGRYMRSRFNGVEMRINDDGSFELLVPGATDVNGKPDQNRDESNKGSKLTIGANGDITIDDQAGDSVKVSPGSKSIEVTSAEKLSEKTKAATVEASSSWKLRAPKVVVVSDDVSIGGEGLTPAQDGVVRGEGIDTFTGLPYAALGNASVTVKAKK